MDAKGKGKLGKVESPERWLGLMELREHTRKSSLTGQLRGKWLVTWTDKVPTLSGRNARTLESQALRWWDP